MTSKRLPLHILQELADITVIINSPLQNVQRIKYTCFDVSKSMLVFGATSGGIYVFNRWPCEFVQLIPSKDGPLTRLAISADEKHIGFANGKGTVTVTECDQSFSGAYSSSSSKDHYGNEITAMIWNRNMLFSGDDIGKISVLQMQNFIAKTMFQSSSQVIMSLDSRICQLDSRGSMLLISTLTKCYLCNVIQEQYRQIGQKLRDGEFGACFGNKEQHVVNGVLENNDEDIAEVKRYNVMDDEARFIVGDEFNNTVAFCARPSSRLWEATIDGMVRRTHQFKQVLAKQPMQVVTEESYNNENISIQFSESSTDVQSVNFLKIFAISDVIFSYGKNALYFLNVQDVDCTMWFNTYKDIVDCKIYNDMLYVWLNNGTLVNLRLMKIEKFLLKCYLDEKFTLCSELCTLYEEYLLTHNISTKLHILTGLRGKVQNIELLKNVLNKFDNLKSAESKKKTGIYVINNTYNTQLLIDDNLESKNNDDKFSVLTPDTLQALKGLSVTVSDKLNSSKQRIKEKWEDFEGKMKNLNNERQDVAPIKENGLKWIPRDDYICEDTTVNVENEIIYKESSQIAVEVDNNKSNNEKLCQKLYQYSILGVVNVESEVTNLISIIETHTCDINEIYKLMLLLKHFCVSIEALDESEFIPNNIFLTYLSASSRKYDHLDTIINDDILYKYFVDSCISVNVKTQKLNNIGCECGYPLPYVQTSQMPVFSQLIDEFIERQWSNQTQEQCYEVCKRMPHLWRKILYLRRNEDLLNVLRVLLQMLDENLLHSFLPQFTLDTWDRAIQLYSKLYANICLNCGKKFDHISVKDMLSWDHLGSLIIKSLGGKNAIRVMKKHGNLIEFGALTIRFYHACVMVSLFEKFDGTIVHPLVNALYKSYDCGESRIEICNLLQSIGQKDAKNTALPLVVAATSPYWGLKEVHERITFIDENNSNNILNDILLTMTTLGIIDCTLCGLPLHNLVLIKDGGLWVFKCGHTFHGACLELNKIKLCPSCSQ